MRPKTTIIVALFVFIFTGCSAGDYKDAMDLYSVGNYEAAKNIFATLGEYKSSLDMYYDCVYQLADIEYNKGNYEKAKEYFEEILDYKDCVTLSSECTYQLAEQALEEKNYDEAKLLFESIPDYKDSISRAENMDDEIINTYLSIGDYYTAYLYCDDETQREEIYKENQIAYMCEEMISSLKDRSSFELYEAWYSVGKEIENGIFFVNAKNSYGGRVSSYWMYTYDPQKDEYTNLGSYNDLEDEKINSWDDTGDILVKMLENEVRDLIRNGIKINHTKVPDDVVARINKLYQEGLLKDIAEPEGLKSLDKKV